MENKEEKIDNSKEVEVVKEEIKKPSAPVTLEDIKNLLEKNLKWSQIIYEQNRKINRKLMWQAVSGWLRILLVAIPIILAIWFLPSYVGPFVDKYGYLWGMSKSSTSTSTQSNTSIDQLIKLIPLDPAKQEQLKTLLK